MVKRVVERLASIPLTLVSAGFLLLSLSLLLTGVHTPVDVAWVSVFICGVPLVYLALHRIIFNKGMAKISSALLIVIAMLASLATGEVFAAGEVTFIMALGAILEEKTTQRAQKGLKNLWDLVPTKARKLQPDKSTTLVDVNLVAKGDLLRVLPGDIVPVDGIIVDGSSSLDQSVITGESLPVDKTLGEQVFCGTTNRFGTFDIKATEVGQNSSLQVLISMVKQADKKTAPLQRIADTWATWLVPLALIIALAVGFITQDIIRGVTVLVVFCPCALVLATPTAIMAAIGQATKQGVIIKSAEALERMAHVDVIAFDKTGTLTQGALVVSEALTFDSNLTENDILNLAASLESYSEHPLAKALVASAPSISRQRVNNFEMALGCGVQGKVNNASLICGNPTWLKKMGYFFDAKVKRTLASLEGEGKALVMVGFKGKIVGILALSDQLRIDAKQSMKEIESHCIETVLLSGDRKSAANYFARLVGVNQVYAELLPQEKATCIQTLQTRGKRVCMIGDGINDAPALKTASVGIAMGKQGSSLAVDSADIALMNNNLSKISYLISLSTATVRTIKFSIGLSLAINALAIALSVAGVLVPTTGALVHNAGSVLVVLIAASLYDRSFNKQVTPRVEEEQKERPPYTQSPASNHSEPLLKRSY